MTATRKRHLAALLLFLPLSIAAAWAESIASYGYTGREPDASGLIYSRARYLDPTLGRFTQRDPLGMAAGVDDYGYVDGNPANAADPTGLTPSLGPALRETQYFSELHPAAIPDSRELAVGIVNPFGLFPVVMAALERLTDAIWDEPPPDPWGTEVLRMEILPAGKGNLRARLLKQVEGNPLRAGHAQARIIYRGGSGLAITGHGYLAESNPKIALPVPITMMVEDELMPETLGLIMERGFQGRQFERWVDAYHNSQDFQPRSNSPEFISWSRVNTVTTRLTTRMPGTRIYDITILPPTELAINVNSFSVSRPTRLSTLVSRILRRYPGIPCVVVTTCTAQDNF